MICNPYEIVIQGITNAGATFRPSDWAERLAGVMSSFDEGNRLAYHEYVRPMMLEGVRCVAVDKKVEHTYPAVYQFLMDFAKDNNLRVVDCRTLLNEVYVDSNA